MFCERLSDSGKNLESSYSEQAFLRDTTPVRPFHQQNQQTADREGSEYSNMLRSPKPFPLLFLQVRSHSFYSMVPSRARGTSCHLAAGAYLALRYSTLFRARGFYRHNDVAECAGQHHVEQTQRRAIFRQGAPTHSRVTQGQRQTARRPSCIGGNKVQKIFWAKVGVYNIEVNADEDPTHSISISSGAYILYSNVRVFQLIRSPFRSNKSLR